MGHHYIPQYYLQGFTQSGLIWVHDKVDKKSYLTQPKSTGNEKNMYSNQGECYLTEKIENPANPILDKIRRYENISDRERNIFSRYLAVMWLRVPSGRQMIAAVLPSVIDMVRGELLNPNNEKINDIDTELNKFLSNPSHSIWQDVLQTNFYESIIDDMLAMKWQFVKIKHGELITSDDPYVRIGQGAGDASKILEISFPISYDVALIGVAESVKNLKKIFSSKALTKQLNSRVSINSTRYIYSKQNEQWILPFHLNSKKNIYPFSFKARIDNIRA